MIATRLLSWWDGLVCVVAVLAVVIVGVQLILSLVKLADAVRNLAAIIGFAILLVMLPSIILAQWNRMPFSQQFGVGVLMIVVIAFLSRTREKSHNTTRK